ncbi:MAG: homoserine O-acetyltransferase [Flavobacteriales bacterium]|nr:homoserine O-acetyltransferase [Flavobacteriales bacterium]
MINYFQYDGQFKVESGEKLEGIQIAYSIYGNPNATKVIWVCHALSGNSEVLDWWPGLFGENRLFDPVNYKIICANVLGGCYGSSGAESSQNPSTFPLITIKDMVKAHILLADHLGVNEIDLLIGPSLGGQQAVEWAVQQASRHKQLILIACNAAHSALGRAFNETQRLALKADPTFGKKKGGAKGLKAARAIAMLSYRSYEDFEIKQTDFQRKKDDFKASSYVRYQGEKFINRFSANAYYTLTKAMDSHDVARGREGNQAEVLSWIEAKTLVVGISSDLLFPLDEQRFLANHIPGAELGVINSVHGHDAFLINYDVLEKIIADFLWNDFKSYKPTSLKRRNHILN